MRILTPELTLSVQCVVGDRRRVYFNFCGNTRKIKRVAMSKKMKKIPTRKIKSRALFFLPTYATVRAADKAARIIKLEATAHSQPFSAWISRIMEKRYSDKGSIYCLLKIPLFSPKSRLSRATRILSNSGYVHSAEIRNLARLKDKTRKEASQLIMLACKKRFLYSNLTAVIMHYTKCNLISSNESRTTTIF